MKNIIAVKNTNDCPDTTAEVIVENNIDYIPKVSVIIPVYNAETYLKETLDSVVNQTLKEIEIICIDDASKDSSLDILKEYAKNDKRFTVLRQNNLHAGVARNAGIAVAKGKYVHFLDSDDWIDANTYAELYLQITKVNTDVMKFKSYTFDNNLKQVVSSYFTDMGGVEESYFDKILNCEENYSTLVNVSDAPWSGIYKLDFIKKNNCYFDNLLCSNDVSFFYRCLTSLKEIYLWDKRFVYYRVNNNKSLIGIRAYNFDNQIQCYKNITKVISSLSEANQKIIKAHLLKGIFYWYIKYMNEDKLDIDTKKQIKTYVSELLKNTSIDLIHDLYKNLYMYLIGHPEVSVILPVCNEEIHLRECLDSIINQTLSGIEIICINYGSTDNSLDILNEYASKDVRIIILDKICNNVDEAIDTAIQTATGEHISVVNSEDVLAPNILELFLDKLKKTGEHIHVSRHKNTFLQNIFSVRNYSYYDKNYKIITFFGIKIKYRWRNG